MKAQISIIACKLKFRHTIKKPAKRKQTSPKKKPIINSSTIQPLETKGICFEPHESKYRQNISLFYDKNFRQLDYLSDNMNNAFYSQQQRKRRHKRKSSWKSTVHVNLPLQVFKCF